MFLLYQIPFMLGIFGIAWYVHVTKVMGEKSEPYPTFLGLVLFYLPLLAMIIPLFMSTGANGILATLAVIVSVPMSTILFTSAVIRKFDGKVIIAFLALNLGIFGFLYLVS